MDGIPEIAFWIGIMLNALCSRRDRFQSSLGRCHFGVCAGRVVVEYHHVLMDRILSGDLTTAMD